MKLNSSTKILYPLVSLLLLVIFFYFYHLSKNEITTNQDTKQEETNTETLNVLGIFEDMNTTLMASIQEKDFVQSAQTSIEGRCPFYKPDGATYRECLSDWEQSLEAKVLVEQADEVHAYCSNFTKKYSDETSLEGQELFLKCSIFKLQ